MMKPWEIQVRVQQVSKSGNALCLLYKDSRYDMEALDAEYGKKNWQNHFRMVGEILICDIEVWDEEKKSWVHKENAGNETHVGEDKGYASDALKRAGTNWGVGRELYSAPDIWIKLEREEVGSSKNGSFFCRQKFYVQNIGYNEANKISFLQISDSNNRERFSWSIGVNLPIAVPDEPAVAAMRDEAIKKVIAAEGEGFTPEWKAKVMKGIPKYDEPTLKRLINEKLKEVVVNA